MRIVVLRLGHRPQRDQRITTHVGLTARAFGAEGMLLASQDKGIEDSIKDITSRWGGSFYVKRVENWKNEIKQWKQSKGKVVHLTMYGLNLPDVIDEIISYDLMIVVGAEKVPSEVYELADWNIAIGNQPHSEVAALAVMLDRLHSAYGRDALKASFPDAKIEIVPSRSGKRVKRK